MNAVVAEVAEQVEEPLTKLSMFVWEEMCAEFRDHMFQNFEAEFGDAYRRDPKNNKPSVQDAYRFVSGWCSRLAQFERQKTKELNKFLDYTEVEKKLPLR